MVSRIICFIIAIILGLSLLTGVGVMPGKRFLYKDVGVGNISVYGVVVGLAFFVVLSMANFYEIDMMKLFVVVCLFFALTRFFCEKCGVEYRFISVYEYFVPLMVLFYACSDVQKIVLCMAVGSAIGRLGCISAGCCHGKIVEKNKLFAIYHGDAEQLINIKNGTKSCYAEPTVVVEAIIQFIIAGLCLVYPMYASKIFAVGSIGLLFYRKRYRHTPQKIWLGLLGLVGLFLMCGSGDVVGGGGVNYLINVLVGVVMMMCFSNDINADFLIN